MVGWSAQVKATGLHLILEDISPVVWESQYLPWSGLSAINYQDPKEAKDFRKFQYGSSLNFMKSK